jgi:hypothetical protein
LKAKFKNKIMSETVNKKEIAKQYVKASVHYGHPQRNGTKILIFYMQNMGIIYLI